MHCFIKWYLLFTLVIFIAGCKKDLLHLKKVQQIETFSSDDRLHKIYFTDAKNGFIVGGSRFDRGIILSTHDSGKTWVREIIQNADKAIFGISSSPSGILCAISFDGRFIKSTDAGQNWKVAQLNYEPYKDLAFSSSNHCILIGGVSYSIGYLVNTDSAGLTIKREEPTYELNDIEMQTASVGYISGYGVVQKTEDSGFHWRVLNVHNDNFSAIHAYGNTVWICGYNGSMFVSYDGGDSWQRKRNGNDITLPRYRFLDFIFIDAAHGFAIGEDGLLVYTNDGGDHWMEYDRFTTQTLRSIVALNNGKLMVCGDNGSLFSIEP